MISKTEFELLETIVEFKKDNYFSPTIRELTKLLGIHSIEYTKKYLGSLVKKGYLEELSSKSRDLSITYEGRKLLNSKMN